jgi:N-acetylglutamate synthase-like GNAT family acetyltransferase
MALEMLVVHPAYWRRGHGTDLVKWCLQLSTTDKVGQAVLAAEMGAPLYQKLGYEHIDDIDIPGDEIVRDGMHLSVLKYTPKTDSAMDQN